MTASRKHKARQKKSIAHAREARHGAVKRKAYTSETSRTEEEENTGTPEPAPDIEECCWDGTVNHYLDDDNGFPDWIEDEDEDEDDIIEMEGPELVESLNKKFMEELETLEAAARSQKPTAYENIMQRHTKKDWEKAESNRGFGYNGLSSRTKRRHNQDARKKEKRDAVLRQR